MSLESVGPDPRPFRICTRCGRPTPSNSPECVNCGMRSVQAVVEDDQARSTQAFARAYFSRATPLTYGILVLNALIYLVMTYAAGGNFLSNLVTGVDPATLVAFGAKTNELLGQQGEWFRLITPIFIHGGLIHIASNSYALWIVGPQVERLYGSARFVLIYLLCGVAGVVGSYIGSILLKRDPSVPSVGASGAIFGLFGVLAVFGYKYRHELPAAFRRGFGSGVLPVIVINLLIGFSVPFIDNSAHIGGLICGALAAILIPYIAPGKERISSTGLVVLATCVVIVGYSFFRAWQVSSPHLSRRASSIGSFLDSVNEANRVMQQSISADRDSTRTDELAKRLDQVAEKLDSTYAPDEATDAIRRNFAEVLRAQRKALLEQDPALRRSSLRANAQKFSDAGQELRRWVTSSGRKYGIVESRPE
jgi:rhomboid protease GluP